MQDLAGFEFLVPLYQVPMDRFRLPDKFAEVLYGRAWVLLRSGGDAWVVEVLIDGASHMYLQGSWEEFARVHDLRSGHFIIFTYDGAAALDVRIFDGTMCRRNYNADSGNDHAEDDDDE